MASIKAICLILFTAFMLQTTSILGQSTVNFTKPSYVLVQLSAERNRTNALVKANRPADLELFKSDVSRVMAAMVNDFHDHYSFCPVYYYIDTNLQHILAHNFKGYLLNSDLTPNYNPEIPDSSNDFLIVYNGIPTWQTNKKKWEATKHSNMGGKPNGNGLIINDHNMKQISYVYWLDFDFFNLKHRNRGKNKKYSFTSKKFNLEYLPSAAEFNRRVLSRYNKMIKRKN